MYSPFFDKKGKALNIERLKYIHLSQLIECDEGHHLEYKLNLEDGGKAQLAKEIASFANCEGGWLIIGIDDKTREIRPIDKKDYSQKIGKIATRITPMPEFETRFLTSPDDSKKGVLVVYVYEGKNAPYVCNGSVYVRSGSSKEPIKSADRGNIEYLYERATSYRKEIENFCQRDIYYPYNNILNQKSKYPIVNIYIKNISSKNKKYFNIYANRDEFIEFVNSKYNLFSNISYAMDSIIFKHRFTLPGTNSATFIFEFFYDWSCKMSLPLGVSNDGAKESLESLFYSIGIDEEAIENFKIADGTIIFNSIYAGLLLFRDIASEYKLKEKDYAVCVELENASEVIVGFTGQKYEEYIKKYGIPYVSKENNKGSIFYLRDYPETTFSDLPNSIVQDDMGAAMGYRSDCIADIIVDANKKYKITQTED